MLEQEPQSQGLFVVKLGELFPHQTNEPTETFGCESPLEHEVSGSFLLFGFDVVGGEEEADPF